MATERSVSRIDFAAPLCICKTGRTVSLRILSVKHDRHGLAEVERVAQHADALSACVQQTAGVEGVLTLLTCNRIEFIVDAPQVPAAHLRLRMARELDRQPEWVIYEDTRALEHLFKVACGLDSMVIGEREVTGQLRRTLQQASERGHTSGALVTAVNAALRTARKIGAETELHDSGRSIVACALDLSGIRDWSEQQVLLMGTGAYAGAVVAALRRRGVHDIAVHSASNRATGFAERHGIRAGENLVRECTQATLIVTCRGGSATALNAAQLAEARGLHGYPSACSDASMAAGTARPLVILDLSLPADVDPGVAALPGITLLNLEAIQNHVSPLVSEESSRASQIVSEGVAEVSARLASRVADPAVASLRASMLQLVDDEVARLPQGRPLTTEDCTMALHRLATRLLHIPSIRARDAAVAGRMDDYLDALEELYGIEARRAADPRLRRCPVTGLSYADLEEPATDDRSVTTRAAELQQWKGDDFCDGSTARDQQLAHDQSTAYHPAEHSRLAERIRSTKQHHSAEAR
ncbi:glutamyl-tRNA reductase [Actinobaculum sp. 313]|uniref:glutamyl-tRNA reductase n=1 Tax=Actinobaculum sp. 313 TaxID=2495645 RepID=UPI001F0CA713|nr:glutamyl-tRNA reductase [Actinobaculum sp. 313]